MYYELTLFTPTGSTHAILKDISVIDGCVHGTIVGKLDKFDENGNIVFAACEPRCYAAGGSAFTLIEYKGELK